MSLFMGFWRGFVHRFLWICSWVSGVWVGFGWRLGGVWVGIWVVGFRFDGCDFFRWVGGFVPIGLMVGLGVWWVCLVVGLAFRFVVICLFDLGDFGMDFLL